MINGFALILMWVIAMGALLFIAVKAPHWFQYRRELKKFRAWFHKFERGEHDGDT